MGDLAAQLGDRTLADLTLPGTHDSGAYELYERFAPDSPELLEDLIEVADEFGVDLYPLVASWGLAQNVTLLQQATLGARYFDFRASFNGTTWTTDHMLQGNPSADLLADLAQFLDEQEGEVIVVDVSHLYGSNTTTQLQLVAMIEAALGRWLVPWTGAGAATLNGTTLATLQARNQRALVTFEACDVVASNPLLWCRDWVFVGDYANADNLTDMETWNDNLIRTTGGTGPLFTLWYTLTPQDSDIVDGILFPSAVPTTLRQLADECMLGPLDAWFSANAPTFMLGNIFIMDALQDADGVALIVQDNLRGCLDQPSFRAPSLCRTWAAQGQCSSPIVQSRCPRSCGLC